MPETICKRCENCMIFFETKSIKRRFCSHACRYASRRAPQKKCEWCGIYFKTKHRTARFCSYRCAAFYRGASKKSTVRKKQCKHCSICFSTYFDTQKYCSRECYFLSTGYENKVCVICGEPYRPKTKNEVKNRECCSLECAKTKEGDTKRVYTEEERRRRRNRNERHRRKTDPMFKLATRTRTALWRGIKKGNRISMERDLGYTMKQLKRHLEKQFKPGMTWENYGEWQIDHIVPLSAFNFSSPDNHDFKRCWGLKNLQPLWASDNYKKGARLESHFQPGLAI